MNKTILELERDAIAPYQKDMYNGSQQNPNIGTRFALALEKRSQASHIKAKMDFIISGEEVIYKTSKKYDYLLDVEAHLKLFPIDVKPEYRDIISIRYKHNLGHHIFQSGEWKIDEEHFGFLDTVWLDIHSGYFVKTRKLYNKMIGKVDCLEDWTTSLPSYPIMVPQPYGFCKKTNLALPILKSVNNEITFHYKLLTKLTDLIEMRILNDGSYQEIPCNLKYLDCVSPTIPTPQLFGRYAEITEPERTWRKSNDKTGNPVKHIIFTEDISSLEKESKMGSAVKIPLEITSPVKHLFWVASRILNLNSPHNSAHNSPHNSTHNSNYSTQKDLSLGWNPCSRAKLEYGDKVKFDLSYPHFDTSEAYYFNWPNYPKEPGYNVHTFTFEPGYISWADSSTILKNCGGALTITLADTDPFLENRMIQEDCYDAEGNLIPAELVTEQEEKEIQPYTIHIRAVVLKRIEVYWEASENRLKYLIE